MAKLLNSLGRFCARHSLVVIGIWIAAAVLVGLAVARLGAETSNDLSLPGTGSQKVQDLLTERFPPQQNGTNPIVFNVTRGKLTDDANKQAVNASIKALRNTPHVYSVTNPLSSSGQTAGLLSKDKQTGFAPVLLDVGSAELNEEIADEVFAAATEPADKVGIKVAAAGSLGTELSDQATESSEVIGILAAMLILTLVLGSLVAMGMPILTAIIGLGIALATIGLLGHLVAMPDTGATLATMIGLGVGIDYSLFLITRHQDQLKAGVPMEESIARAVATSGSAIVFAGSTVVVALVALRVAGIPLLSTLGLASAAAVVTAVLAAISFLPAMLGLVGRHISNLSLPSFMRRHRSGGGMWASWAGVVARHPVWVAAVALAALLPLIVPAPSLRFGQEDIGATSPDTTERQAYDLITAGFGVGYNGPLQVASSLSPPAKPSSEYTKKYDKATALKKELDKAQKQLPKEQKQLEQQQKQLERQQKQLEKQQRQLERASASLQAQQAELLQQQAALEDEAAQLQAEGAELESEEAALEQQGQQLKAQKQQLKADKQQLQNQKRQLDAQQARLEDKQARLEARRDALRDRAQALAAKARPLVRQLARIEVQERILERRIARLDDRPRRQARLEARLAQLRTEEQQVRSELAPLREQAERLAEQARALAEQAAELQQQANALQAEGDQLEAEANQLQAEGDQLKAEAQQLKAEADQLARQAASLPSQAARLDQEKTALEQEGAGLLQQANALQAQGDQLQAEGDQLQQEGNELQQQGDELKAQQKQAEQEQKQAEKLQKQLTNMLTAAGGDDRGTDPRVVDLQTALSDTSGVVSLTPPQINTKGDVVVLSAVPSTSPASVATADLLGTVRDDVIPPVEDEGGITSYVGGYTASYVDLAALISERLLLVIATVILLGFLLLMIAFRSLLVPLQAAVTNVLSAAAAFGVLTATFQWGWGVSLIGIDTASDGVPIASYVPLMMFAVLFGLSMDYEVFLVSHIQQHHLGGEPARQAVASGLRSSARITTAACLIMTSVFASFILNGDPTIKQFGVGLATAVFLAGILVVTLAPAAITLMGEAAWWLPRWLDRLLPHINIEGEQEAGPAPDDPRSGSGQLVNP